MHSSALLTHLVHTRCPPRVHPRFHYMNQQCNCSPPLSKGGALTYPVCLKYTKRTVYIVSSLTGALLTSRVQC